MTESQGSGRKESPSVDIDKVRAYLTDGLLNDLADHPLPREGARQAALEQLDKIYQRSGLQLPARVRDHILRQVLDDLIGFGPIQGLLDDPVISEVMVNGPNQVFIERDGELSETQVSFQDEDHLLRIINRMIHPLGKRLDSDNPTVDARLPDGSRVNAVIPPVAVDGPLLSVRKFLANRMSIDELIQLGSLTEHMAEFLRACVVARLNVLISGPTSSGKTTMLNILSGFIPRQERIITIEDAVELQLKQTHVARMETRPASVDGRGAVTTRDLVRNALRMRPDRIIVGEVRSGEALDMLQAMNTGHSGSLTTLHANSPRDAISRLETMAMMAGLEMPLLAIRKQIASAINLIVHQNRLEDGSRKTTQITEVAGMESDVVTLTDIFKFEQTGISPQGKILGELKPTGIRPLFSPRLEVAGFKLKGEIFGAGTAGMWGAER